MNKNKRKSQIINIINDSISVKTCMKLLNLEINSYFLCLLSILEDTVLEYKSGFDYSYLIKVSEYIEKIYKNLSLKKRESYRSNIMLLIKIYKKMKNSLLKKDRLYFNQVYNTLSNLLNNSKQEVQEEEIDDINLYELLEEVIFNIKKLEYVDKLIDNYKEILNVEKDNKNIFYDVINEYIKQIVINNQEAIDYYERIINKFLLEETFDLNDQMKKDIIKTLSDFVKHKRNLNSNIVKRIKVIIDGIYNKSHIFNLFNIPTKNPIIYQEDLELLKSKNKSNDRVRINEYIITIDDDNTKVLDDAISYKRLKNGNTIFRVHIADPLGIVPYNSNTYQEALKRVETIYNKNDTIDMLPSYMSYDKLSLIKGQERYAKTFCYELDSDYNIVDFYILNTIIKVSDRLSYDVLNKLYKKGGRTREEEEILSYYDGIVKSLKKILNNVQNYHEEKEKLGIHKGNKNSFSEYLVSYSMILTGYMTSNYFNNKGLPYVYRCNNQDINFINILDKLISQSSDLKKLKQVRDNLPKSYYSKDNVGHKGLGLDSYSHITSPLRRYSDLLNMNVLNTCYFKDPTDVEIYDLETEIENTSRYLNMQNNTIDDYLKSKVKIK